MSTHEMIPAPVPGGMACKNCKAYSTEIAYALGPVCAKPPAPTPAQPVDETERLHIKALRAAEQFIVNGVEMGYIRMPDAETPDTAHDTLPLIRAALQHKGEVSRG